MQRFWCRTMPALHYASVNPYEPCLLDTVGHVLLVPPNPSELYIFPPSSKEFPNILQEGPDGDLQFKLSLLNVSLNLCTRPHLLMEEASTLTSGQGTYQGTVIFLLLFLVIPAMKNVSFFLWYEPQVKANLVGFSHKYCSTAPAQHAGRTGCW